MMLYAAGKYILTIKRQCEQVETLAKLSVFIL